MQRTDLVAVDQGVAGGGTIETISPLSISRSTPRSAGWESRPVRYTFSTPRSWMSVPFGLPFAFVVMATTLEARCHTPAAKI
jgi:hypothetical protein